MSRSLDAYYWTGNHDDGVALKLNRDNSFNYDRWSDCGLDKAGNGMYTVKGNTLELNFEYDSVHITIENEYLDGLATLKIGIEPQYEDSFCTYKLFANGAFDDYNAEKIELSQHRITGVDKSGVLRIYHIADWSRIDSFDYVIADHLDTTYRKSMLHSDPNYTIAQDSTWQWKINRRRIEMHHLSWEVNRVKNGQKQ